MSAPVSSLPTEILGNILEEVIGFEAVRVRSTGRVIGYSTEWLESPLYKVSVICRAFRACVLDLPAWNAITIFHDQANPYMDPPNPNRMCFLKAYVDRAIAHKKRLRVRIEVGSDRGKSIIATKALQELLREGVLWRSCGYQSWDEGSLRMLCEVLDELGERSVDWDRFEVDIGEPPIGDLSLVDVVKRMNKMRRLEEVMFELGWPAQNYWVWNRSPDVPLHAACLRGVQCLDIKASPSICLGLLEFMSGVSRVRLYLDWEEGGGWGVDQAWEKPQWGGGILKLTQLAQMEVYIGVQTISHATLFHSISCPRLRRFSIEWFERDKGNGVEVVQRFLERISQAVTGSFYLPDATSSEVGVFQGLGLEGRAIGTRMWADL
ncbi:hypothetical protein V5O48_013292 [Marasmius crinis-equi]|uniref:F-box domain-containing protein n=1 Tax=Marasmius crinis-equi TaxID=585013 RepID=A0ABR3F0W0_9AGAR